MCTCTYMHACPMQVQRSRKQLGAHIDSQVTVEYNNADTLAKAKKAARPKEVAKPAPPVKRTREDPKTQAKATGSTGPIAPTAKSPSQAVSHSSLQKRPRDPLQMLLHRNMPKSPHLRGSHVQHLRLNPSNPVSTQKQSVQSQQKPKQLQQRPSAKHAATPRAKSATQSQKRTK